MGAAAWAAAVRTGPTPVSKSRHRSGSRRSLRRSLLHRGASLSQTALTPRGTAHSWGLGDDLTI